MQFLHFWCDVVWSRDHMLATRRAAAFSARWRGRSVVCGRPARAALQYSQVYIVYWERKLALASLWRQDQRHVWSDEVGGAKRNRCSTIYFYNSTILLPSRGFAHPLIFSRGQSHEIQYFFAPKPLTKNHISCSENALKLTCGINCRISKFSGGRTPNPQLQ